VDSLRREYLDGFLTSPEHTLVMRSGRRSVHLLATPADTDADADADPPCIGEGVYRAEEDEEAGPQNELKRFLR
jgi:hypothetical protein